MEFLPDESVDSDLFSAAALFSGKSWIGIQDASGAQIFSGSIKVGESKSFAEDQLLQVTIGNAAAVSLNVNGKEIGTPGGVGEVVRLSFTPDNSNNG